MRGSLMYGSVRGTRGNSRPYRDTPFAAIAHSRFWPDRSAYWGAADITWWGWKGAGRGPVADVSRKPKRCGL
jgi:hypothetical protein